MSEIVPDSSSVVSVKSSLCLGQGAHCKTADSLTFVLDGESTRIHKHTQFNSSLCPQK